MPQDPLSSPSSGDDEFKKSDEKVVHVQVKLSTAAKIELSIHAAAEGILPGELLSRKLEAGIEDGSLQAFIKEQKSRKTTPPPLGPDISQDFGTSN